MIKRKIAKEVLLHTFWCITEARKKQEALHKGLNAYGLTISEDNTWKSEEFLESVVAIISNDVDEQQSVLEWLLWYIYDNNLGEKGYEAGFKNKMKPIKNVDDLLELLYLDAEIKVTKSNKGEEEEGEKEPAGFKIPEKWKNGKFLITYKNGREAIVRTRNIHAYPFFGEVLYITYKGIYNG